jgi:hypothetical protein
MPLRYWPNLITPAARGMVITTAANSVTVAEIASASPMEALPYPA